MELDWLKFDTSIFYPKYGTPESHKRNKLHAVRTGWAESQALGFLRVCYGDVFTQLLKSISFAEEITDQPVRSLVTPLRRTPKFRLSVNSEPRRE